MKVPMMASALVACFVTNRSPSGVFVQQKIFSPWVVVARSFAALEETADSVSEKDRPVMFANVLVRDPSKAIGTKLEEKVLSLRRVPNFFKRLFTRGAKKIASSKLVSPSIVAGKMSHKMKETLPVKMLEKGLTVTVEETFREGPYFVLELQVQQVDTARLAESKTEMPLIGRGVSRFWNLFGSRNKQKVEDDLLPVLVQKKMSVAMGEMLREKFSEKGMSAEVETLPEEKQATYFSKTLEKVRIERKRRAQ